MKKEKEKTGVFSSVEKTPKTIQKTTKLKMTWQAWGKLAFVFLIAGLFWPALLIGCGVCFFEMSHCYYKEKKAKK